MTTVDKAVLRDQLLQARRAVPDGERTRQASALLDHVAALGISGATVCAYVPVGSEPGSFELLDALCGEAGTLLLPIARTTGDGDATALQWGRYRPGRLVSARFGLLEPSGQRLPAEAVAQARVVVVPALAVDRTGTRLGRGRGFYDRTLVMRDPQALLVAVVRDEELLDELPREPHDVPMTHALTPGRGLVELALAE